ncbi:MAG: hypothetical protein R3C45_20190 [Phycisphaerales bacterium]
MTVFNPSTTSLRRHDNRASPACQPPRWSATSRWPATSRSIPRNFHRRRLTDHRDRRHARGGGDIGVDLINNGTLSPGDTASLFAIDGDYTQDSNASLNIDLYNDSGPAGAGFDALDVTGTATLQGVLNVLTVGAFMPSPGDTFQIITASTISGTFASIFAPNLAPNLILNLLYATDSVTLQVISTLPGDLNGDGFVGIADLNIILSN